MATISTKINQLKFTQKLILVVAMIFFFYPSPTLAQSAVTVAPTVDIDVEVTNESAFPEFGTAEGETIRSCAIEFLGDNFPFDQIFIELSDLEAWYDSLPASECPSIEIFNNEYEACFIVSIYEQVRPLLIASLLYAAIIAL